MRVETPTTEQGVLDALLAAQADGRRVRIVGGGLSAQVPPGTATISTLGLRGIVDLRASDLVVTVLAGTPLVDLDAALREVDCELPIRAWDEDGRGTIGGAVAASANGLVARNGYDWRDVVLGARLAVPTGAVIRVGASVVKSVAGFDVPKALCGSHGDLGVITCLDLRIDARPRSIVSILLPSGTAFEVAACVAMFDRLPFAPRGLVLTAAGPSDAYQVDAQFAGPPGAVEAAIEQLSRTGTHGWLRVPEHEATTRWSALTRRAAVPPPRCLHRRVAAMRRAGIVARCGGQLSGDWLGDILRQRATWIDSAPSPPPDPAVATLYEHVRRSFDPGDLFRRPAAGGATS